MPSSPSVVFSLKKWPRLHSKKEGMSIDPEKIKAVVEWQRSTNVIEVQSFLGLAGYYRCFVEGFSKIATPMTKLL